MPASVLLEVVISPKAFWGFPPLLIRAQIDVEERTK